MSQEYKRCRATVARWPMWDNLPCRITRGLVWDAKRGCYWCHVHKPKPKKVKPHA